MLCATLLSVSLLAAPADLGLDREPEPGRNLPYSPADGERVTLNPPPFRWLPARREVTYALEIAPGGDFAGPATRRATGLIWCCEMLQEPLPPGDYAWRYGAEEAGRPVVWSRARAFTVPADAARWPFPADDAFRAPAEHPRLFVTRDKLPELRRRAREGDLKPLAESLVRRVQAVVGQPLVPEPERLPTGPDRAVTYARIFRETRPPMDRMEDAALAWLLTGDAACGAEARRRVLHFFAWDPRGSTGVDHNDEPAMWVMMRGVRAYDWAWELFSPAERADLEACMRVRASDFYRLLRRRPYENNPYESHAGRIIGFLGEAALAFLPEWPEAAEWLRYITRIYWGVWPAWGKDDGGWNEGPLYWAAYMDFALHFVVALRQATGIDVAQRPFFRHTPYYRLYLTPPGSNMAPFGDATQFEPRRDGSLLWAFSALTGDPVLRWYAEQLGSRGASGILGVVLNATAVEPRPPVGLPPARHFDGVGLVCLNTNLAEPSDNITFALRSSPFGAVSHGHNDQNCFVLEAFGEPLAIASGYYPVYGSPHHDRWTRQTKAKCGITFDGGQGQDRGWQARGAIRDFHTTPEVDWIVADATAAYGGALTQAVRRVAHLRPGLFVVCDDLAAPEPRRFEYQLHALDAMAVAAGGRVITTTRPKAILTTHFLEPAGLRFEQSDRYDPPPETDFQADYRRTWHVTASLVEPSRETRIVSVLAPRRPDAPAPAIEPLRRDGASGCRVVLADGRRAEVWFGAPDAPPSVALSR